MFGGRVYALLVFGYNCISWRPPVAQWMKDPVLSLPWRGSLRWREFHPWPGNFYMLAGTAKIKKKNPQNPCISKSQGTDSVY